MAYMPSQSMNQQWNDSQWTQGDEQDCGGFLFDSFNGVEQLVLPLEQNMFSYGDFEEGMMSYDLQHYLHDFQDIGFISSISTETPSITGTLSSSEPIAWNTSRYATANRIPTSPVAGIDTLTVPVVSSLTVANPNGLQDQDSVDVAVSPSSDRRSSALSHTAPLACSVCGMQKNSMKDLRRHIVETHEKPFHGERKLVAFVRHRDGFGAPSCANAVKVNQIMIITWSISEDVELEGDLLDDQN
ncbi:hypothetical protein PG997_002762 [Apiospora hydei]|uniref:C2H2-type domain-containing protein n=1 Tax=Apiospora hydei TaxID=1337664 RepID=A0ABR1WXB2_9PEZI